VERSLRVAAALGVSAAEPRFDLPITAEDTRWARETLLRVPGPRVVLNLGARWLTKRWPPEHFAEIARRAVATYGAGVVAVGSPGDRPLVQSLMRETSPIEILDLCGRTSLHQLAALAVESDVLISNDTGPLHVAAAAGARVIGIYTCTDPRLTGPFGPRATTVQTNIWCKCSLIRTCDRMECMSELLPDRVWPAVQRQIELAIAAA
jgi:heptosyltransferase I